MEDAGGMQQGAGDRSLPFRDGVAYSRHSGGFSVRPSKGLTLDDFWAQERTPAAPRLKSSAEGGCCVVGWRPGFPPGSVTNCGGDRGPSSPWVSVFSPAEWDGNVSTPQECREDSVKWRVLSA